MKAISFRINKIVSFFAAMMTLATMASSWYAAPEPLVDPSDPNYCLLPEAAGTVADAVEMANHGLRGEEEVVLLDGDYWADWEKPGLIITQLGVTIRSFSGRRDKCVLHGGGTEGSRRAFRFIPPIVYPMSPDERERLLAEYESYVNAVSNLTFIDFHLDNVLHTEAGSDVRKGGVIRFAEGAKGLVDGCDFIRCGVGKLGEGYVNSEAADYGSYYDNASGGAINAWTAPLYVRNSNFRECFSASSGSAISFHGNRSWFDHCTFVGNVASNTTYQNSYRSGCLFNADYSFGYESWASNCVFRDNRTYTGRYLYGGGIVNVNTYRCEVSGQIAYSGLDDSWVFGAWGASIYCDSSLYRHVEDRVNAKGRPHTGNAKVISCELFGGVYNRCRLLGDVSDPEYFKGGLINKVTVYNSLFQDCHYDRIADGQGMGVGSPVKCYNCTFANCYGTPAWNNAFMYPATMVNCAMLDCEPGSGAITEWNGNANPPPQHYDPKLLVVSNTVYAGREYIDWSRSELNNTKYDPANPDTPYRYADPMSMIDPWRPSRDSYLVNRGMYLDGMADRSHPLSHDLLGNPRISQGMPDIGCYEYYIRPGVGVSLR